MNEGRNTITPEGQIPGTWKNFFINGIESSRIHIPHSPKGKMKNTNHRVGRPPALGRAGNTLAVTVTPPVLRGRDTSWKRANIPAAAVHPAAPCWGPRLWEHPAGGFLVAWSPLPTDLVVGVSAQMPPPQAAPPPSPQSRHVASLPQWPRCYLHFPGSPVYLLAYSLSAPSEEISSRRRGPACPVHC